MLTDNRRILNKVKAIAAAEFPARDGYHSPSLLAGSMGQAIFLAYLYSHTGNEQYKTESLQHASQCMDALTDNVMVHTYCNGFTGIAAGLHHLAKMGLLDDDPAELLEDIDPAIHEFAMADFQSGNWDFLHGGLGAFHYFLSRSDYKNFTPYFEKYLNHLEQSAEQTPTGLRWQMKPLRPEDKEKKLYSLGLSHGLPSIMMVLALCIQKGIAETVCRRLLRAAGNQLLANKLPRGSASIFPSMESDGTRPPAPSRMGWCYGDLSIAVVLYTAGDALNDDTLKTEACTTAMACTKRIMPDPAIYDAGFCHGAAGIAQIYLRLHQLSGEAVFLDNFYYWVNETLLLDTHPDGIAGYKTYMGEEGYLPQGGLLEGVTGTALVLLTALEPERTTWDNFFLLS